MTHELSVSQRFARGSGSVGTILAVLVAVLIGYLVFKVQDLDRRVAVVESAPRAAADANAPAPTASPDQIKTVLADPTIIKFGSSAKVTYIEALDPGCPWCHTASGYSPEIAKMMSPDGRFKTEREGGTYKSATEEMRKLAESGQATVAFTLMQTHSPNLFPHKALYCAHKQGKFWDAYTKLLSDEGYYVINPSEKQDDPQAASAQPPSVESLSGYLADVTDARTLATCMSDSQTDAAITQNQQHASSLGLRGTPSMLVNGQAVNWADYEGAIKPIVEAAMK